MPAASFEGEKPAHLPVIQPSKIRTGYKSPDVQMLDLTIPDKLLATADGVPSKLLALADDVIE
jgi:hypothetical protein